MFHRVKLYMIWAALLAPVLVKAGDLAISFEEEVIVGDDVVSVHMSSLEFSPEALGVDMSSYWDLNGTAVLGGFPAKPSKRLGFFYVIWQGKRHNVAKRYYEDVFDPNLQARRGWWDNNGGVLVRVSDDDESILVEMDSSHIACCGYIVTWIVDKNGSVSRFVDSSVP